VTTEFGGIEVGDLPPHPRNTRSRLRYLFLKVLQHRTMHPQQREHQGWFKVHDQHLEFARSIPKAYCVEGVKSLEQIDGQIRAAVKKFERHAVEFSPELGAYTVRRRHGRVYLKHTGKIPKTDSWHNWLRVEEINEVLEAESTTRVELPTSFTLLDDRLLEINLILDCKPKPT